MRFTGQVKIPDLDYPGVPASVQVDGKQVELFVEGESLGRWSLVDVRAERLVSSAFSLKLAGEEVTFIADQPTEFAYGGVEAMANVWARHRSMRLPRRIVANSRSRQGTKTSRIPDLREAIEETLAGTSPTALDPARPPLRKEASGIASLREATGRREPDIKPSVSEEEVAPTEVRGAEPQQLTPEPEQPQPAAAAEISADAADTDSEVIPDQHEPVPEAPDTPDAVLAEPDTEQPLQPPATDSVFKQSVPWATREEAEPEDAPEPVAPSPPLAEPADPEPVVAGSPIPDEDDEDTEPVVAGSPIPDEDDEDTEPDEAPERVLPQSGSVPWLAPPLDEPDRDAAGTSPEPPPEDVREEKPKRSSEYVVDLGAFEDRSDDEPEDEVASPPAVADDDEDASLPMATAAAKGGIIGAVRSAFVRNRVEHTHVYVEAPGGLGIKRQICAECGHISIGVE